MKDPDVRTSLTFAHHDPNEGSSTFDLHNLLSGWMSKVLVPKSEFSTLPFLFAKFGFALICVCPVNLCWLL